MTDNRVINKQAIAAPARRPLPKQTIRIILYGQLLVLDCLALFSGFSLAGYVRGEQWLSPAGIQLGYMIVPLYVLLAVNKNAYSINALASLEESLRRALGALLNTMLIILMISFFFQAGDLISRLAFASAIISGGLFITIVRIAFYYYIRKRTDNRLTDELLIIDGDDYAGSGHENNGNILNAKALNITPDLHDPQMLSRLAGHFRGFDRVIIACPPERQPQWSLLLKGANIRGEIILPQTTRLNAVGLSSYDGRDTLIVARGPLNLSNRAKKRMLDIAITVPALLLLSPLFLILAIAIKLDSPGPIFFRQQRMGRANQPFYIMKFRSMRVESCDANGQKSTQRDDDRITRVGRFIRKTSIDELPQLLNVLHGDMSIVGPRPHALGSLAGDKLFWEVSEQYWVRHALKPGITGLAQIRGYRGSTLRQEDLEKRLGADLEYMNGWRLWRDISILLATVRVVVHRNAY